METTLVGTKPLYVRLPAELHRRLKLAGVRAERPMSELVLEAIVQYLDREGHSNG